MPIYFLGGGIQWGAFMKQSPGETDINQIIIHKKWKVQNCYCARHSLGELIKKNETKPWSRFGFQGWFPWRRDGKFEGLAKVN